MKMKQFLIREKHVGVGKDKQRFKISYLESGNEVLSTSKPP